MPRPGKSKRSLLNVLETQMKVAAVCVVSSREKLEAANQLLGESALNIKDIR
ncbi:MAG: hypothetical protein HC898_10750 [Phycisphaerales bacterium]|nr:hypothetical protein [Phycisphaerales bacterium]